MNLKKISGNLLLQDSWDVEEDKSSEITVVPERGIIRKQKERTLDKTLYEVFSTIFFSELFRQYNNLFRSRDFTFYAPQAIRFEYGEEGKSDSLNSVVYQFFCPGTPLNKVKNSKKREYKVDGDDTRVEERLMYLSGIITGIFMREGVLHGDPQLRHFLFLPHELQLQDIDRDGNVCLLDSRNGLGTIDCENARIEGAYSEAVKKEVEKYKERAFIRFGTKRAQEYFEKGSDLVKSEGLDFGVVELAYNTAKKIFDTRFGINVKVNMENKKVYHR